MSEKNKIRPFGEGGKALPRTPLLIGGAALGVILLLTGSFSPAGGAGEEAQTVSVAASESIEAYTRALEEKICAFCEQVEGVSRVSVAVSVDSGYRRVYAQDDSSYILVGSGSSQGAIYLTEQTPEITGIAVVCAGGDDPRVRQTLIGLLSAAYGIGTNKIYIAPAQN